MARSSRSKRTSSKDIDLLGALSDFEAYAANFLYIKTKDARLVNLRFNNAQKLLWSKIRAQMDQNKPVRLVCLKGRQLGCSTFVVGFHFWRTVTQPNTHSLIVAHDLESTQGIFSIASTMYESLPPEVRPMRRRSNKKELLFENPDHESRFSNPGLRSKIEVRTAGNKESGRGAFYHTLHLSEVSSYPDPELLAMSLFPTVPPLPGTSIIIESTAKGAGTWFHDFWIRSNNGETGFEPVFLPWFLEPAYTLPTDQAKEWLAERPLDEYEVGLKRHFKLTDNQIAFRRYLLSQHGEAYVLQEYPSTPDEAFLGAGMPVFDRDLIRRLIEESYKHDPVFVGDIDTAMGQLVPRRDGHLKIWEMPEPHSHYVIGVDSAYGVAGGSRTAVSVLKRGPEQTHVATYVGYATPLDTVPILEFLGTMYNTAMITVEVNGAGLAIQEALSRFWPRCVAPETLVLTGDLRWVRADEVSVGDVLVGIDEFGAPGVPGHRYIRKSVVEEVDRDIQPRVRVVTKRGSIVVSSDHKFLVFGSEKSPLSGLRRAGWVEARNLVPRDRVAFFVEPWDTPQTWEVGVLYGYYQGEGSLRLNKNGNGLGVSFTQKAGPALEEVLRILAGLGFGPKVRIQGRNRGVMSILIEGIAQSLRFLGMVRPPRLLEQLERWWGKGTFPRNLSYHWDDVVSVEPLGSGEVVVLNTSTRTFVAGGYVAHNCYQWRYLDNVYHKPTEKGGWLTTHTTKPILISHFNYMLNHGYFVTYDRDLLEEAFGFVYVDNERSIASAGPGYTDDILMATMIASLTDWLDAGYSRYGNVRRPELREPRTIQLYDPLYVDTQEDLWTPKGDLL